MLPRGEERAKGVSHFQNSLPRPRKMGPYAVSFPLCPVEGELEGGVHSSKVGRMEQLQQREVGAGSGWRMRGKQERLPQRQRRKAAEHVILGDIELFLPCTPRLLPGLGMKEYSQGQSCWWGAWAVWHGLGRCPRASCNPSSYLSSLPGKG